jgi:recombination protein RecR
VTEGPAPLGRLVAELQRLPGIGQRTAQRLAFHLLRAEDSEAEALADSIREMKEKVGLCEVCFNLAEGPRCRICTDASRDPSLICVVEEPADVIPIERTHEYRGLYHVLGGALSPIDGIDPEDLRIAELFERARLDEVSEVVLATNPTTTGEATALHIAEALRSDVTVTRLASGLPVGADLEHADEVTLGKALVGRQALEGCRAKPRRLFGRRIRRSRSAISMRCARSPIRGLRSTPLPA